MQFDNPRIAVQVRAALRFWQAMAAADGQHPSRHPNVAPLFQQYAPMTTSEIDRLLEGQPTDDDHLMTVVEAAGQFRIQPWTLRRALRAMGLKPVCHAGQAHLYTYKQIIAAVGRIMRKDTHGTAE